MNQVATDFSLLSEKIWKKYFHKIEIFVVGGSSPNSDQPGSRLTGTVLYNLRMRFFHFQFQNGGKFINNKACYS